MFGLAATGPRWPNSPRPADDTRQQRDPRQSIDWAQRLAESCRFRGRPEEAIPRLERILPLHDRLNDRAGKRDTLQLLAAHLLAARRFGDAQQRLQEALRLHERLRAADPLIDADLSAALAEVLEQRRRPTDAESWRLRAIRGYRKLQAGTSAAAPTGAGTGRVLEAPVALPAQQPVRPRPAADARSGPRWSGDPLIACRLKVEQGSLEVPAWRVFAVAAAAARGSGRPGTADAAQSGRAAALLLNLAVVELVTGGRDRAIRLGERCLELYRKHGLADDLMHVEACNLLGTCAAQEGNYARAIGLFREGVTLCGRLGAAADPPRSNLLLNVALVHKAQGDLSGPWPWLARPRSSTVALPHRIR